MIKSFIVLVIPMIMAAPQKISQQQVDFKVTEALRLPRVLAAQNLIEVKSEASKMLKEMTFNEKWPMKTRWKAFMIFMKLQGENGLVVAEKAYNHSTWFMRSAAITAMTEVNPAKAKLWAYKSLIKDPALMVRMKALDVLKDSRNSKVRKLLWSQLHAPINKRGKKSLWIRADIARELTKNPMPNESRKWVRLLYESDKELQLIATQALNRLNPKLSHGGSDISFWREQFPKTKSL